MNVNKYDDNGETMSVGDRVIALIGGKYYDVVLRGIDVNVRAALVEAVAGSHPVTWVPLTMIKGSGVPSDVLFGPKHVGPKHVNCRCAVVPVEEKPSLSYTIHPLRVGAAAFERNAPDEHVRRVADMWDEPRRGSLQMSLAEWVRAPMGRDGVRVK